MRDQRDILRAKKSYFDVLSLLVGLKDTSKSWRDTINPMKQQKVKLIRESI